MVTSSVIRYVFDFLQDTPTYSDVSKTTLKTKIIRYDTMR